MKPERWSSARDTVSDRTLAWLFLLGLTNGARIEEIGQTQLANVKTDGGVRYLDLGIDARVKAASRVANRVIDRAVNDDPRISLYSLRHNFKDLARDATIEKYIMDQIMGHAGVIAGRSLWSRRAVNG